MKKFLLVLLTLSMLLTAIPFSVSAEGDIWDAFYDSIPWDDKNNYIDYDNEDGHKTEGYRPGKIKVFMTEEFMSTHEAPTSADFNDEEHDIYYDEFIIDIVHNEDYDYNEFDIVLLFYEEPFLSFPIDEYAIDGYIYTLKELEGFDNVEKVQANYIYGKSCSFLEEWTVYDNYFYYKNEDEHKESGYSTSEIVIEATDAFIEFVQDNYSKNDFGDYYLETDIFPEIKDKVISIRYVGYFNRVRIKLENPGEEISNYTEEHIDAYVELLEYFCDHPIVTSVKPGKLMVGYHDTETGDTTEDTEEVTTEPITKDPEETTLPETTASETTSDESENVAQKNHQTGDELYFLMASAVLSVAVVTFVTTLKRRVKSK